MGDWHGLVESVGIVIAATLAIANFVLQSRARRELREVHKEVKTINGQTVAQMAEANESRRIDEIAEADRSVVEREHLATVPVLGVDDPATPIPEPTATGVDQPTDDGVTPD